MNTTTSNISACYVFSREAGKKSRFELVGNSENYPPLHHESKGKVAIYLCPVPDHIKTRAERKPNLCLVGPGNKWISGLFFPDMDNACFAYGDIKNTFDALLVVQKEDSLEIYVAPGKKNFVVTLFSLFVDADPDLVAEMEFHRQEALRDK